MRPIWCSHSRFPYSFDILPINWGTRARFISRMFPYYFASLPEARFPPPTLIDDLTSTKSILPSSMVSGIYSILTVPRSSSLCVFTWQRSKSCTRSALLTRNICGSQVSVLEIQFTYIHAYQHCSRENIFVTRQCVFYFSCFAVNHNLPGATGATPYYAHVRLQRSWSHVCRWIYFVKFYYTEWLIPI